jgi:peptidoglycan hydrolase CwlO-like protein
MNYLIAILIALTVGLVGCGESTVTQEDYDSMVYEKDLRISELESQVTQMQEHIENLEAKTQEVNSQFERLQTENWRDVVPDAESSLDDLNNEISNGEDTSSY